MREERRGKRDAGRETRIEKQTSRKRDMHAGRETL